MRVSPAQGAAERQPGRDAAGLLFAAEMYGLQLDHLAAVLGVGEARARSVAARWRGQRHAESARLGPGGPWTWVTRAGLATCGLPYTAGPPALGRLAHIRAVTAVRLALEAAPGYAAGGGYWRSERRLRARMGGRVGLRQHIPDGEVHWPDGTAVPWAGECWAIEAELTPKPLARTAAIMAGLLAHNADYYPHSLPGAGPRYARVVYLTAPAARTVTDRAAASLPPPLAARMTVRDLPPGAAL